MEATVLFVAVAALILLAVTSMRFGIDSREGFSPQEGKPVSHETDQIEPAPPRRRRPAAAGRWNFSTSRLVVPRKCVSAACGA